MESVQKNNNALINEAIDSTKNPSSDSSDYNSDSNLSSEVTKDSSVWSSESLASLVATSLSDTSTMNGGDGKLQNLTTGGDENANRTRNAVGEGTNVVTSHAFKTHSSADKVENTGPAEDEGVDSKDQSEESEEISCISSDGEEGERTSGEESDLEDNTDPEGDFLSPPNAHLTLRQRISNPTLPETVTVLETAGGSKVYLVGTAHFSLESQEDVATTIQSTQPDIVMVELCNSRVNILALDEKTILEESKNLNFEKMQTAIKQNGLLQGAMYLLLLSMSAHITKQLGMAPGGEFRRAFSEARKVPGCLVHLGDRPIQITLKRALSALSIWQKLRLAWYMITSKQPISKEEVERCKRRDLLEELLAEMTGEFPALSTVFVKERDIFLAYSLRLAATPIQNPEAPNGLIPSVVVGVVGIGHVSGIVENWDKVTEADIPPILSVPEPSTASRVIRKTVRYSLLGLALWGCYRFLVPRTALGSLAPKRSIQWLSGLLQR